MSYNRTRDAILDAARMGGQQGELPLPLAREGDFTPVVACRRCGQWLPTQEAITTNTHSFCTLACLNAHQEQEHG